MDCENIISIFKRHSEINIHPTNVIVFYNCCNALINLFANCNFLLSYVTEGNNIIIYNYDKSQFPTAYLFYFNIINETSPYYNNSFSYKFENNIETYYILHMNSYAELLIYHDDLESGLGYNSIEFNVNGISAQIPSENIMEFNGPYVIYQYIINRIEYYNNYNDHYNFSDADTVVDYEMA